MSRKCSDQFYYAVRIGRKPGIYRGWYGEYGAKKQITGIRNYDYSTGYLKTSSWEDADVYMRAHELFSVESDFTIKKATPFNEDMSVVHGETHVAAKETPAQNAFFPPSAPSVPYHRDEKLESFLQTYYKGRVLYRRSESGHSGAFRGASALCHPRQRQDSRSDRACRLDDSLRDSCGKHPDHDLWQESCRTHGGCVSGAIPVLFGAVLLHHPQF